MGQQLLTRVTTLRLRARHRRQKQGLGQSTGSIWVETLDLITGIAKEGKCRKQLREAVGKDVQVCSTAHTGHTGVGSTQQD